MHLKLEKVLNTVDFDSYAYRDKRAPTTNVYVSRVNFFLSLTLTVNSTRLFAWQLVEIT